MFGDRLTKAEMDRRARPYVRSVIAHARALNAGGAVVDVARGLFPGDKDVVNLLTKGTVTPTSTSTTGLPVTTGVEPLIPLLGPASASGGLFRRAVGLSFGDAGAVSIPEITASGAGVAFVAQGAPFPIRQLALGAVLTRKRLALGCVLTRELYEHANSEVLFGNILRADLSLGLETLLFDAVAGDTTRPTGLKNGIAAIAADAGTGGDGMINDLANLAAAVAPVGAVNLAFIASPKQFVKIQLRKPADFPWPILCSSALADRQVACIALDALAVAGAGEPRIEVSRTAPVVMQDTDPGQFSIEGTPNNIVSAPIANPFQADLVSLRIITDIDWALRSTSGFAWTQNVNW